MSEVILIHEPDIFFDLVNCPEGNIGYRSNGGNSGNSGNGGIGGNGGNKSNHGKDNLQNFPVGDMHHGEIYIYLNQIFLHHKRRWYKADIDDIINIQTNVSKKQILIRFSNFEIVLHCNDYTHLIALRDFLSLTRSMLPSNNFMVHTHDYELNLSLLEGGNGF